ncbi:UDP-N-acetylglucosamine acyltransferase [Actinokineospora globicatena]|uniref:Acyl-[acyl-carrier-protein]--UDP-N-acetylglucosamine O-acyltransferase n=1 Tax=Actinokineospora globicatena TaxID=103729 RepID=A0A9W6QNZ7_9PSEU|nr:UDP-N-acetylglucosamine acyltransferase [Actinokineospora globicatena]GLW91974.1 acyl-[acyl-carrier-protein]--UDP-N-acetylglucosamine O-acyltransferase [Actinokineospora globicatena]
MGNRIHPTAVIGPEVELGDDNVIGPYSVLVGPARIGSGNWFGPRVDIGQPADYRGGPHPVGWDGETGGGGVVIGDGNTFKESVSITQGMFGITTVGSGCYVMGRSWIAHDCTVDSDVTITSGVQIAGHCRIWTGANLGLGVVVHQRTQIGPGAMVGMGTVVIREIPAFAKAVGNPARTIGYNTVGLTRRGVPDNSLAALVPYLAGESDTLPDLPADVAALLKSWQDR